VHAPAPSDRISVPITLAIFLAHAASAQVTDRMKATAPEKMMPVDKVLAELLKQIAPHVTRALVLRDPTSASGIGQFAVIRSVAQSLGLELTPVDVRDTNAEREHWRQFADAADNGYLIGGAHISFPGLGHMRRDGEGTYAYVPLNYSAGIFPSATRRVQPFTRTVGRLADLNLLSASPAKSANLVQLNVRFGSKADMCSATRDVRFTPESGHPQCTRPCLLWANSGRPHHSLSCT
jgi:hypothetical protein